MKAGKVYLIGAGPGDPGLLTRKAERILGRADVVLYDALMDRSILSLVKPGAELIPVGKRGGKPSPKQKEINELLIRKARAGKVVARLKGGDPFVLGRGAEEALALVQRGVQIELVPGVTSAIAAPTYAGIPLTHRDFASSFSVITGQEDPAKTESGIDWKALASGKGTLVFLMGLANLDKITGNLVRAGLSPRTPVGIVENGTYPFQRTVTGDLRDISQRVRKSGIKPPAVIIVGEVVRLREKMNWFEKKPLFGKKIVITRAREQASALAETLQAAGAWTLEFPTIEILGPRRNTSLDQAIGKISGFDWLVLTSPNGVRGLIGRMLDLDRDLRDLKGVKIAVIGPATREELGWWGIKAEVMPGKYYSRELPRAMGGKNIRGKRILLARSEQADPDLPRVLRAAGGLVTDAICYRTARAKRVDPEVKKAVTRGDFDGITFTSSSTVINFLGIMGKAKARLLLKGKLVAAIGEVTARALKENKIRAGIVARKPTIPDLAEAIIKKAKGIEHRAKG